MPTNAEIERYLLDRRPDVVLFTPYLGLRSVQPDFLRAAQALGLRTAVLVKSWDNLSSKSVIRPDPRPPLRLERGPARRGQAAARGRPGARRRHRARSASTSGSNGSRARGTSSPRRAGLDPDAAVRALRVLLAVDGPVGGRLRPALDGGAARARRRRRRAGRARPPAPEAPRRLATARRSPASSCSRRRAHAPTDDESKADYFDSIHHSRGGRRPEHERDDRGGDRRPAGADRARPRVRARPAGHAPLPLPARGRRRAAHGRADARRARSPARAGDRGRGRRPLETVRRASSSARTGSTWPRPRCSSTRSSASRPSAAPAPAANAGAAPCRSGRCSLPLPRVPLASRTRARPDWALAPMRILFQLASPAYLRIYGSTIQLLAERGHRRARRLRRPGKRGRGATSFDGSGVVGVVEPLPPASRRYEGAVERLRATSDYLHYPDPALRRRAVPAPPPRAEPGRDAARLTLLPYGSRAGRAGLAVTLGLERLVPADAGVTRGAAPSSAPDVVFVSPLIGRSSPQPAADRHGQGGPAARHAHRSSGSASWDHLTTKGVVKARPDATLVWNELQRRDAAELHSVPRESVVVTGAQLFDPWFDRGPSTTAEEFAAQVGLGTARTCSTSAPRRTSHRRSGRSRSSAAGSRPSAVTGDPPGALIRPHPYNVEAGRTCDLAGRRGVVRNPTECR